MANATPRTCGDFESIICGNCHWVGLGHQAHDIKDLFGRVEAGGEVPAAECPQCGALCYLNESPDPHTLSALHEAVKAAREAGIHQTPDGNPCPWYTRCVNALRSARKPIRDVEVKDAGPGRYDVVAIVATEYLYTWSGVEADSAMDAIRRCREDDYEGDLPAADRESLDDSDAWVRPVRVGPVPAE